jgi:uncharacterized protein YcbK (DUF882 family)
MTEARTTVMILLPGRNAVSFAVPRSPWTALCFSSLMPLLTGAVAQHYVSSVQGPTRQVALGSLASVHMPTTTQVSTALMVRPPPRFPGPTVELPLPRMWTTLMPPEQRALSLTALPQVPEQQASALEPAPVVQAPTPAEAPTAPTLVATAVVAAPPTAEPFAPPPTAAVIDVKSILHSLSSARRHQLSDEEVQSVPKDGPLRLEALHLGESVDVHPFDAQLQPNTDAMAQIAHAMRCRITGTEIPIDTRLVEILVQLHTLYGKPIELVSGHRQPLTIGTKKTSQHTLGRAADIRIPGVGIEELRRAAMKLGARGIGIYPEKGFVHVDVRQKSRYFWVYTAASGEQQVDMAGRRVLKAAPAAEQAEPAHIGDEDEAEPSAEPAHAQAQAPEPEPQPEHEEASQ